MQPAATSAAEIAEVIADYARAIGSRDVAAVRRAYPSMTADQQRGFEQFFQSVRALRADFTVSDLDVVDSTADARVSGAYEFVGNDGRTERQPIAFRATLRRHGATWKLMAVR
jgi:serine/threonine-protein kinase